MQREATLLQIARRILSEEDEDKTPEILLRQVLEAVGAERGFIVAGQDGNFEQRFQVRYDRSQLSSLERRFSRGLVLHAIEGRTLLYLPNVLEDPRFAALDSVMEMGRSCVLVAPLSQGDTVYGAVYLEHRGRVDCFPPEARQLVAEFAELAGGFLRRAAQREALRERARALERDLLARHDFAGIVTADPAMLRLLGLVAQVADSELTVLVRGETGTGKELVARALHMNSARKRKPFVPMHCTALPSTLLESELFGHVKGAFTGAESHRAGRVASAEGGTLFLDEIAEIPPELQAKLLRFLQFGEVQRLGSDRVEKVEVRIVAATHQDLAALVEAGRFRQDLYFRLKVLELTIPPLRERRADIPLLLDHFTRRHWRRPAETPCWSARAARRLEDHSYPGNVRELEHLVQRACVLARGPELDLDVLPPELAGPAEGGAAEFLGYTNEELRAAREAAAAAVELRFLQGLMGHCAGNISQAARQAGVPRSHLQRRLAHHGLRQGTA